MGAKNWRTISLKYLKGKRSDVQCLHRWQKVGAAKGAPLFSLAPSPTLRTRAHRHSPPHSLPAANILLFSGVLASTLGLVEECALGRVSVSVSVRCRRVCWQVLRPGLVKGPWTRDEDDIISECMLAGITKWSEIAQRIPGRIGKQCRERW